jgi:hypothetical protein
VRERKVYGNAILWPRPVVLMVLGERSFTELLEKIIGATELTECLIRVKRDLLKRRQLCQLLFYSSCMDREAGKEAECRLKMQSCYGLENPIIEVEWYLARGECETLG